MDFLRLHRISAALVFLISLVVLIVTMAPTVSFWDCGEFIAAAVTMSIPHPPGAPTFQLIGRIFSLLPFSADVGYRVNMLSVVSSALSVLFTYLAAMRLLRLWHGDPETSAKALPMILASAAGALILSFSDTFWFNAVETEMYGIGMFFISLVVWLALEWYSRSGRLGSSNTLLLIAYLLGFSIGVHLLTILVVFFVFALMYFRDRQASLVTVSTAAIAIVGSVIGFSLLYPGMVKTLPSLLGSAGGRIGVLLIMGVLVALVFLRTMRLQVRFALLAVLLAFVGYSTYALVIIRANDNPPLNENDPSTFERLYSYLNRDQYGGYPLVRGNNYDDGLKNINMQREKFLPRRWNPESVDAYKKYGSDFSYFMQFQFGHIYLRYFLWNFVGRAGDLQDAPAVFASTPEKDWSDSEGYPNRYFAIPFLLGLLGIWYHFRKDRRTGLSMLFLFLVMGIGLVVYFNMAEPQVRERDYFFVGSFYVFALWAGLGVYALVESLAQGKFAKPALGLPVAALLLVIGPGNMLYQNFQTHDRSTNYVAYDFAYNLLQSCDKDAILFTGGDNDTFPLWCLQYAYGIRRDIRVVNLELLNTDWCGVLLKTPDAFGAKAVRFSPEFTDERMRTMQPAEWKSPTPISVSLDPARFDRSGLKEVKDLATQSVPSTFTFTVEPTFTDPYGLKGLRIQDILALEIVRSNLQDRPIYFAMTTSPGDHLGLRSNMILQGFAYRVTPFTFPTRTNRYYNAMDIGRMTRMVNTVPNPPQAGPADGFLFRELNNPHVNLDEASSRMMLSYRYLFMGLAQAAHQEESSQKAAAILKRMDEVVPPSIHSMDMMLKTDLVTLQTMIGNRAAVKTMAPELESYYLKQIEVDPMGRNTDRNPWAALLNLYDVLEEWDKAIQLLERAKTTYPGDAGIEQQILLYRAKKSGQTLPKDSATGVPAARSADAPTPAPRPQ